MEIRYLIELAYDGTNYHGWQVQPNAKTIQECLNEALSTVCRQNVNTVGCGRTDTGVHAQKFFAHFDSARELASLDELLYHCNQVLPPDIAMRSISPVSSEFHARFSAKSRTYHYLITQIKDPFSKNRAWEFRESINVEAMNQAATILNEHDDFGSFSKSNTQSETNICTITSAQWYMDYPMLRFEISANRFLRNMVRAIVGTVIEVGRGRLDIDGFRKIIESKDRSEAGLSVPACGLYLVDVQYPKDMLKP